MIRLMAICWALMVSSITAAAGPDELFRQLETDDFKIVAPATCESEFIQARHDERRRILLRIANEIPAQERSRLFNELNLDSPDTLHEIQEHGTGSTHTQGTLGWIPDGQPNQTDDPQCSPEALEDALLNSGVTPAVQAELVRDFFTRCERNLTRNANSSAVGLIKLVTINYNMCRHPWIRKVKIRLSDGNTLSGLLAMKPGNTKRPLVITRCGVSCNIGGSGHRYQMMHLFDEGPFNVLALANITGSEYIRDNEHLALGGFDGGMQIIRLAHQLRNSPLQQYTSSVHFTGVSLGGQDGLFASVLNERNTPKRSLSSVLALCPVVDLEASVGSLFTGRIKGPLVAHFFFRQLLQLIEAIPILRDIFPDLHKKKPRNEDLPVLIADGAVKYYRNLPDDWAMAPFDGARIKTREDLWGYNRFSEIGTMVKETPTLLWAGNDDWIVPTKNNSLHLDKKLKRNPDSPVHVLITKKGNHCAFPFAYGWEISSMFHRAYLISHSPELLAERRKESVNFDFQRLNRHLQLMPGERHFSQIWRAEAGRDYITVRFKIHTPLGSHDDDSIFCLGGDPYASRKNCYRTEDIRIPYTSLAAAWAHPPENETEAEAFTRWANNNLKIMDSKGRKLHMTKESPAQIIWTTYEARNYQSPI